MKRGRLISFEGLDGAGKTTQIKLLEQWLKKHHVPYVPTREPGGTALGVKIRDLVLNHPELAIMPLAETLLFQADRTQHFATVVLPALQKGELVITDRFFDASIAYQGYGRGVDVKLVKDLSMLATQGYEPDLTILLDLNPGKVRMRTDVAHDRKDEGDMLHQLSLPFPSDATIDQISTREDQNRFDTATKDFHRRVREGFRALANSNRDRIKVIDASRPMQQIHQAIVLLVEPLLDINREE